MSGEMQAAADTGLPSESRPRARRRSRPHRLALEIAVTSSAGAGVALAGGADRVELCAALELGGITPSQGLIEATVDTGVPAHVLVRCRPGDFVYDPDEIDVMVREIRSAVAAGASGVVVGALTARGTVDTDAVRRFVAAARSANAATEVTLHRAIDRTRDPVAAAALLPDLGLTRVLTSGGAPSAFAGRDLIARMVSAAGPVDVMAGAGVAPREIGSLAGTGIAAVHLSAKRTVRDRSVPGTMVPMGSARDGDGHLVTDGGIVREARTAIDALA